MSLQHHRDLKGLKLCSSSLADTELHIFIQTKLIFWCTKDNVKCNSFCKSRQLSMITLLILQGPQQTTTILGGRNHSWQLTSHKPWADNYQLWRGRELRLATHKRWTMADKDHIWGGGGQEPRLTLTSDGPWQITFPGRGMVNTWQTTFQEPHLSKHSWAMASISVLNTGLPLV